ncbi:MAG: hypothetical protein WD491_02020 [Balneolales bacterium]
MSQAYQVVEFASALLIIGPLKYFEAVSKGCYGKASRLAESAIVHPERNPREAWTPHGTVLDLLRQPPD